MKKFGFILAVLTVMFLITSCGGGGGGNDNINKPMGTKKFWAQNMTTTTFYQLDAEKLAENTRCEVWAEKGSGVTAATAAGVASAYNTVYTKMMNTFGYTINDSDLGKVNTMEIAHYIATGTTKGAKLTILLLDIKDGYKKVGDPYVAGYFHSLNMFENNPKDTQFKYSNALDMIYLDTNPSVPGSPDSNGTLAHEMQHLMNFVTSIVMMSDNKRTTVMETWIDEGLSGAAEWVYSGVHPEERWRYYNENTTGLIAKGNNFYVWDNHKENIYANLDDYATVYLFFQYLRLQSGKPENIYRDILMSEYNDYQAVTKASSLNGSHKDKWSLLLRDWHAANYTNASSGLYGYKDEPDLKTVKAPMFSGGTTVNLYPGEGVYSKIDSTDAVPSPSGNINYAGLNSTGTPVGSGSTASGARLTYNVNTNKEGSAETGNTIAPSVGISIPGSGSVQIDQKKFIGPFKVDASYFLRKNGSSGIPDNEIKSLLNKNNSRSVNKDNNTLRFDTSTLERVFIDE